MAIQHYKKCLQNFTALLNSSLKYMQLAGLKSRDKFHNQQLYIFNMIKSIKQQLFEIQHIALKNIQHNAFALLPKNILYSMVKSDELKVRRRSYEEIWAIK